MPHHASESDDWGDTGEVEEDDRCETLQMECVGEVGDVLRIPSLHVVDQTAKEPNEKDHTPLLRMWAMVAHLT